MGCQTKKTLDSASLEDRLPCLCCWSPSTDRMLTAGLNLAGAPIWLVTGFTGQTVCGLHFRLVPIIRKA